MEIILGVGNGFEADVETKATAITSVPATLYWGATTGSTTETKKWDATSASTSSNKISSGQYQTATPTAYNYYVANKTFSVGAASTMTVADNNTDVLVGRTAASTSTTPSVVLNHIFCRTGSLTLNTQTEYGGQLLFDLKTEDAAGAGPEGITLEGHDSTTLQGYRDVVKELVLLERLSLSSTYAHQKG